MNIREANGLVLRPAMQILADVQQTSETPDSITATNIETSYEPMAKVTETVPVIRLMDLAGDGFLNDGGAMPLTNQTSGKYGYISEVTDENGEWDNPPSISIECNTEWDYVSFTVMNLDGVESEIEFEEIEWEDGACTLTFDSFEPNSRMYILRINLGKTFHFSNDDLVSLTCDLRGVNTSLDEGSIELEMSSVDLSAYCGEGADKWISVFASMDKSSPCRISMGYPDDSVTREFYVSEQPNYDVTSKVLTVRMADATQMLDDNYGGKYIEATTATITQEYYDAIKDILDSAGIEYTESGTVPQGGGTGASNLMITNESKRNIIADAVTLFRDPTKLAITYRDGGIPQLIAGQTDVPVWEINEEDVADMSTDIEYIVRDYSANLSEYSVNTTAEEVASQQGAVAGEVYFLDCSEPVHDITTVTKGTAELITPYTIKFTCTSSGDATVTGHKIKASSTSQYTTEDTGRGVSVNLGDMQLLNCGIPTGGIPGYTMCEYIQSDGSQYIDTGFTPDANTRVEIDFQYVSVSTSINEYLFGTGGMGESPRFSVWHMGNNNKRMRYAVRNDVNYTEIAKATNTTRMQLVADAKNKTFTVRGGIVYNGATTLTETLERTLRIFNINSASTYTGSKIKLYSFKIYDGGTLVRDYVPAYDEHGTIGLYDLANDVFYENDGSGSFTKGSDADPVDVRSLTKDGLTALLRESNLKHNFIWRGNPHWQTHDHILMHMIDGTNKEMTLLSQTFTFEGGGLQCECTTREGWF